MTQTAEPHVSVFEEPDECGKAGKSTDTFSVGLWTKKQKIPWQRTVALRVRTGCDFAERFSVAWNYLVDALVFQIQDNS